MTISSRRSPPFWAAAVVIVLLSSSVIYLLWRVSSLDGQLAGLETEVALSRAWLPGDDLVSRHRLWPFAGAMDVLPQGLAVAYDTIARDSGVTRITGRIINMNATPVTSLHITVFADTSFQCIGQYNTWEYAECLRDTGSGQIEIRFLDAAGSRPFALALATPSDSMKQRWSALVHTIHALPLIE